MKKLFWGAMYVLAAVMVALTIYLYVVPEGEIILGDDKLEQSTEQRPVPVVKWAVSKWKSVRPSYPRSLTQVFG